MGNVGSAAGGTRHRMRIEMSGKAARQRRGRSAFGCSVQRGRTPRGPAGPTATASPFVVVHPRDSRVRRCAP